MSKTSTVTVPSKDRDESPTTKETNDFYWSHSDEPHATRRKAILAKYPKIKDLYGPDPTLKYVTVGLVVLQFTLAALAPTMSAVVFFLTAYIIGGTANHMLMLSMHELAHNLGFKTVRYNKYFGMFANLPIGVPSSVAFKRYHMEHHRYQGEDGIDVDIPTQWEGRLFTNAATKLVFVMSQVFFYAFRPLLVNPKQPGKWEYMNLALCFSADALLVATVGKWGLLYLLLSTVLGSGLHPVAGHFIAEHYVFTPGTETYSYYGILNIFAFNVGYHNEHHDFPFVAGVNLPKVRAMAPEFYNDLPQHTSWVKVIWDYITDPTIGAYSRVKRHRLSTKDVAQLKKSQ